MSEKRSSLYGVKTQKMTAKTWTLMYGETCSVQYHVAVCYQRNIQ